MNRTVYGIDVGKHCFHVVTLNAAGIRTERQRLNRAQIVAYFAKLQPGIVAMETCPGAHYLGRHLERFGHDVRLLACQFVSPYRKSQKNDFNDAEAIAEAASRPTMRFQRIRPTEQLDLQAIHRVRQRLISERTGVINQVRAFLLENGVAVATGKLQLVRQLPRILAEAESCVSPRMQRLILQLVQRWRQIDAMIDELTRDLAAAAKSDPLTKRLLTVPGIGPIVASALVATVGNAANFRRARDLAAWVGPAPIHHRRQTAVARLAIYGPGVPPVSRHPRGPVRGASAESLPRSARQMGRATGAARAHQHSHLCSRKQDRPNCLGRTTKKLGVRYAYCRNCVAASVSTQRRKTAGRN